MKTDFAQLQSLTRSYNALMGWPIGSAGALFLGFGISIMLWGETALHLVYGWLFLPGLALMAIVASLGTRNHQQTFGVVKVSLSRRARIAIVAFILLYVVLVKLAGPDFKNLKVPLEPTLLNSGIILILVGLLPTFPWRHYIAVGLALMGIAFLPAFHVVTVAQFYRGWSFIVPGLAFLLCGVTDRLILAHKLQSLRIQESHV